MILVEPPELTPKMIQIQSELDFINLNTIEVKFKKGEYNSTFQLLIDMRHMCQFHARLFEFEKEKLDKIKSFQQCFDTFFRQMDLENKPLSAPPQIQAVAEVPAPAV